MKKGKILVVEDSRIVAEDIKQKLVHLGYEVSAVATSGEKALEAAALEVPDIALMDIKLGEGMNGIDVAGELRRKHQVPVIYLTAYADEATIERAKYTQPHGYLIKPFDDRELQSAIEIGLYRHQMERKLKISEEWMRTTLTSIGDGVIATDMGGRITFMNPVAESLTGWSQEEANGRPLSEVFKIINELTREPCENPVTKVIQSGQIIGLANNTLLISRDGREMPVKDSGAPIRLNDEENLGVVLVFQDNSEQRKIEEALRGSERELRQTLDATTDGIWSWNFKTDSLGFSPKYYTMLGYEPNEFQETYQNWVNLIHPDDLDKTLSIASEYLKTKPDLYENEFRLRTKTGEYRWIKAQGRVVKRDADKQAVYMIGSHEDITRQKRSELKLLANQRLMDFSQKLSNVGSYSLSIKTEKLIWSDQTYKIFGYEPEEVEPDWNLVKRHVHPDDLDRFIKTNQKIFTGSQDYDEEYRIIRKDGKERMVHSQAFVEFDDSKKPIRAYGAMQDITERYNAAKDKLLLERKLKQSQKMESIGTLAGGIAHDFNNLLSSIIGFTELALDDARQGTSQEDYLQEVYNAGKRAKDLVWQILTFARQADEPTKPIRIDRIANEILKFIRSSIPTTIEIKQDIGSESLIMANPTQTHQIIMNLCTNAAQAMDETGGKLGVTLKDVRIDSNAAETKEDLSPGEYIRIRVSDTGTGIPQEIIGSIFEPYYTTKAPGEGTGMGLAVVQGIVEKSNGKIFVDSKLGEGTVFSVYLPITKKREPKLVYERENIPTGTERILFVDDEEPIAKMGSQALDRLGYMVTTRTSSMEALQLFKANPNSFDLVITDMTMPDLTGDALAAELMKVKPDIPVILCTGYSSKISDKSAKKIGIKAFAHKPIVKSDLANTVRKVLDSDGE